MEMGDDSIFAGIFSDSSVGTKGGFEPKTPSQAPGGRDKEERTPSQDSPQSFSGSVTVGSASHF